MDIQRVSQALSSSTRLDLIEILSTGSKSVSEVHSIYSDKYGDLHRESIYRELENLVDASLLNKEYNTDNKEIQYSIESKYLFINLEKISVEKADRNK